jgi:hypothetical protein
MVATIDPEYTDYKTLYNALLEDYTRVKEERDYWKEQYVNADKLNSLLSEVPGIKNPGNTPTENRKAQGKMTGNWTSYDKMENFDIFS